MVKDKDANAFSREGGLDKIRMASVRVTDKDGNVFVRKNVNLWTLSFNEMDMAEGLTLEDQKVLDDFRADFANSQAKFFEEIATSISPSGFPGTLGLSSLFSKLGLTGFSSIFDLRKSSDSSSLFSKLDLTGPFRSDEAQATDSLHDTIIRVFREQEVCENRRHKQQMIWVRAVFLVGVATLLLTLWQSGLLQLFFDAVIYVSGQLGSLVEYARSRWF